ncbi:phosphodiester glycosidase family protein [Streptomyces sp. NPDC088762]|uniref:phosphodiester glycosidase family protein n=1 Tax=Streptomyces sp. NPDC088762 TaxID=3365891 RepID=UPI003807C495
MNSRTQHAAGKITVAKGAIALVMAASVLATPVSVPAVAAAETGLTLAVLESGSTKTVDTTVPGITRTTYSGGAGPWNVNVVVIDPDKAPLTLKGSFGSGLSTSQTSSSMLQAISVNTVRRPRAGVNGSFFDGNVKNPSDNTYDGDVSGILVRGGKLVSEATKGKGSKPVGSALVLQHGRAYITELSTALTVKPKNSTVAARQLDGINRVPGRIAHCEGRDPGETIDGNGVCWDTSEIVSFTPEYGTPTPTTAYIATSNDPDAPSGEGVISTDEGIEVLLDAYGKVTACYDSSPLAASTCQTGNRGGRTVPSAGRILQGIGEGASWLRANALVGTELELPETVTDTRFGDTVALDPSMYITAGGDLLMRDGQIAYTQPTNPDGSPTVPDAAPRTAVGTDGYGRTLLVTVDGRHTTISKGATRLELATLLKDLGAVDALNMDGGGSTTLVWQNTVVNHPSDGTEQERPVGDTVYAGVGGYPLP